MHAERHAIIALARRGVIIYRIFISVVSERVRKHVEPQRFDVFIEHVCERNGERLLVLRKPLVECRRRVNVLRNPLFTETQHRFLAPQSAGTAKLLLNHSDRLAHSVEMVEEAAALAQTTA